ncbi:hypothetical protein TRVA0_003S00870 [Trichomonascus vanleenenianus]|uniref:CIA30 family protein n=1 Tax=Trichomonascus vanleenenianus TaxID=2268995 RepID=UPI003ECAA18F
MLNLLKSRIGAAVAPNHMTVVNFREVVNPLERYLVRSDQELGGFSTASLDIVKNDTPRPDSEKPQTSQEEQKKAQNPQEDQKNEIEEPPQFGRFSGNLNLDLPPSRPDVVQSGYAMWRTKDMVPTWKNPLQSEYWNWERCSAMLLRVRGDRRKYFVNVQAETPLVTDIYQHRLFLKSPGQWETVVVPLSDFILTNWGVIQQQQELDLEHVRTVGVGLIDKQYGPFQLDIDWIKVVSSDLISKDLLQSRSSKELATPGKRMSIED